MKIKLTLFILLVSAATKSQVIDIPVFATGFSNVVEITNAGDERLFVVEQAGNIKIVNPDGTVKPENFLTLTNSTVLFDGERGLLGLVFIHNMQRMVCFMFIIAGLLTVQVFSQNIW
jgi:hypothetical protein